MIPPDIQKTIDREMTLHAHHTSAYAWIVMHRCPDLDLQTEIFCHRDEAEEFASDPTITFVALIHTWTDTDTGKVKCETIDFDAKWFRHEQAAAKAEREAEADRIGAIVDREHAEDLAYYFKGVL